MKVTVARRLAAVLASLVALNAAAAGPDCGTGDLQRELLLRVNATRKAGYRCGSRQLPPAPPVAWDLSLQAAAVSHSNDMARRNFFEHVSPDGERPGERVAAHRYRWRHLGENIAAGAKDVAEVMQDWLTSADHCDNIMDPGFSDMGVGCAAVPSSQFVTYWTMVLGRKR